MMEIVLTLVALGCAVGGGWLYWQVSQVRRRLEQQEALLDGKVAQVGEVVDEFVMAAHYLYEQMDQHLLRMEQSPMPAPRGPATALAEQPVPQPDAALPAAAPYADASRAGVQDRGIEPVPARVLEPRQPAPSARPGDNVANLLHGRDPEPEAMAAAHNAEGLYAQALQLASSGDNLVDIARDTGIGYEELRLLLRFQGKPVAANARGGSQN